MNVRYFWVGTFSVPNYGLALFNRVLYSVGDMKPFSSLLILAALFFFGCGEKEQEAANPKIPAKSEARPVVAPEPEPTPEPEPAPEPEPQFSSFKQEDVEEALKVALEVGEALELGDDGLYYEKGQEGAFEGWVKKVSSDGKLSALERMENGSKNGRALVWHRNGQRSMEGVYKDNNYEGTWKGWHENGELVGERNYANGVLHGNFTQSWPNGQTMMEGNYVDGNQDGDWETYYENGQRQSAVRYEGGKILGASYWSSNGETVASRPDGSPSGPLR